MSAASVQLSDNSLSLGKAGPTQHLIFYRAQAWNYRKNLGQNLGWCTAPLPGPDLTQDMHDGLPGSVALESGNPSNGITW
jgi:hypothetical protein